MRTIALFLLLCFPTISLADTIHVPGDYATIQAGIDAAVNGDVVLVAPGTYVENIDFLGKAITVKSSGGAACTTIDGNQTLHVVRFINGEGHSSVLQGFTITNGLAYIGGGVFCRYSSTPTILENIVVGNTAQADGGGVACYETGSVRLINNLIMDNKASGYGGGIHCHDATPSVTNNTIIHNTSTLGGGIYHCYKSKMVLTNYIIWDNSASTGPDIWVGGPSPYPSSTLTIEYSDVNGGASSVYVTSGSTLIWGPGNLDADPFFTDSTNNDFHLTYYSPCKDAGDNTAVTGLFDFESDPRIAYGTVDMGADEFHPHIYYTGNATPGESIDLKFIGIPGDTTRLWIGSGILEPPLHHPTYGDWYLEAPILLGVVLGNISADGVSVFPITIPPDYTPWDIPLQAGIGMGLSNLCVVGVE